MAKPAKQSSTQDFREQAVKSVVENKLSVPETTRRLNMSAMTLANWEHKSLSGACDAGQIGKADSDIEAENSLLRCELTEIRLERDLATC
ncbi:MAG: transposase [Gammaproteobacteria bacterium]